MLRRAPYTLGAITSRSRPTLLHSVRLVSFKTQFLETKDAPPIKAYQAKARKAPNEPPPPPPRRRDWTPYYALILSCTQGITVGFLAFHILVEYLGYCSGAYGVSMLPNINSYGDWVWISKYYRRGRGVEVGDIVSFRHPVLEGEYAIKRVMGLEGDFVLMNTPEKSDAMIQIPEGHCWVVGDNLAQSRDSRMFGPLPMALIEGKVTARWSLTSSKSEYLPLFSRLDRGLQDSDEYADVD